MIEAVRRSVAAVVVTVVLAVGASPSSASVILGQIPAPTPGSTCSNVVDDWVQPNEISGNSYVVPTSGGIVSWTITSWSTQASATAGQHWTMKVFRRVTGTTYSVVGHDGPRALTAGALNTFQTSILVKPGDLLGMNDNSVNPPVATACDVVAAGNTIFFGSGNLADGSSGPIGTPIANRNLNISAVADPTNSFSLGTVTRSKKKGTATVTVSVPNPGDLTISGNGVGSASAVAGPGEVKLPIAATGKKQKKLKKKGKVKVSPTVSFTPVGGTPSAQSIPVQLKKKR
jgi:hypothetical protein